MHLSMSARKKSMTMLEMQTLHNAASRMLYSGKVKNGALIRALYKLDERMMKFRQNAIYKKGINDARLHKVHSPSYNGVQLGSIETITYNRGYNSVRHSGRG